MSKEKQPPVVPVVEGAAGDVEEEQPTAKSAEDRKAAAALSKLDARDDESASAGGVDQEAVKNAMNALGGASAKAEVKKVKVDQADVALLVEELELTKAKATDLLKAHDGDAIAAMRAYITPTFA